MIEDWRRNWLEGTESQTQEIMPFGFVQVKFYKIFHKKRGNKNFYLRRQTKQNYKNVYQTSNLYLYFEKTYEKKHQYIAIFNYS